MKKFELTLEDGRKYGAAGESLDAIWPDGLPKVWADNISKVVETDITAEENARALKKSERETAISDLRTLSFDSSNATLRQCARAIEHLLKSRG